MKICLDAGHSGNNYNKGVSAGYVESREMWKYHLLLKAELERYGVEVVTTRETIDENPTLEKNFDLCNTWATDLILQIDPEFNLDTQTQAN